MFGSYFTLVSDLTLQIFSGAVFVAESSVKVTVVPFFMKKSGEVFYCDENAQTDELVVSA